MKTAFFFIINIFLFADTFAQNNFTILGTVVNDVSGLPMAAASVFAQNTTMGTVTDNDGNFKL